jgi:hypothetical protein
MGDPTGSITNPAKLSPWLADNICMSCHQAGDARVLQAGKTYRDVRPGAELDDTLSIFLVPFNRESAPKDDLLEHYLSMRLSKCYVKSGGRLGCIVCHDPHVQPFATGSPRVLSSEVRGLSHREELRPATDCTAAQNAAR